jgi:predicted PurR-regulated permease PerM
MTHVDWNRLQAMLICLIAILVLLVALWHALMLISHALLLFAFAAVLTLIVSPLVDWGERRGLPRLLVVLVTYLLVALGLGIGVTLLARPLVQQLGSLAAASPAYINSLEQEVTTLSGRLAGTPLADVINDARGQLTSWLAGRTGTALATALNSITSFGASVADGVLVLIISIYMLLGGRRIHDSARDLLPARYQKHFLFVTDNLALVLGSYIRGQLTLAVLLGIVVSIGLSLLGLPYALLLGVLATILGLVPMFGSALSAVPAVLVALTLPFPTVLWVLIFFVVVQNVQDQILAPRIVGHSVGLHPLGVMFALLAGAQLGGPLGAIAAIPLAGFIWVVLAAIYESIKREAERSRAAAAATPPTPPPTPEPTPGEAVSV